MISEESNAELIGEGACGGDATWQLDDSGTMTITGTGEIKKSYTWPSDPSQIKTVIIGEGITAIANNLFKNNTSIETVVLPNTIIDSGIGTGSFVGCTGIKELTLPASADTARTMDSGNNPFDGCTGIEKITFTRGDGESYIYNNKLIDSGNYKYSLCYKCRGSLKEVIFADDVNKVGDYLFKDCIRLNTVVLGSSITSIGAHSFENCSNLKSIELPWNLNGIGESSFSGCLSLKSLTLPDNVKSLGKKCFSDCTGITELTLPASLNTTNTTNSSDQPFKGCTNIARVTLTHGNDTVYNYTLSGTDSFQLTPFYISRGSLTEVSFESGVISVGNTIFKDCIHISSVSLPDSILAIGSYSFCGCWDLETIVFPTHLQTIGNDSFGWCSGLKAITIPESVTSIGAAAFNKCTALTELTIPISLDSVTSKDYPAFSNCASIQRITFSNGASLEGYDYGTDTGSTEVMSYQNTPWFTSRANLQYVTISDRTTKIGSNMFNGCYALESIVIPESVTTMGASCFRGCTGLKELTIPIGLNSVGSNTEPIFYGCSGLERITFVGEGEWFEYGVSWSSELPNYRNTPWQNSKGSLTEVIMSPGITSISNNTFEGFTRLTSITIPSSVQSIGDNAFKDCTSLTAITIPDTVNSIGTYSFYGCSNLATLTIPINLNTVVSNRFCAFEGCSNLDRVVFTIGSGNWFVYSKTDNKTGNDCYVHTPWYQSRGSITAIVFEYGITEIPDDIFEGFAVLNNVTLPSTITSIGLSAFSGCGSLRNIALPSGLDSIKDSTFMGCSSLESITIPSGVTCIGSSAFKNCSSLREITIPENVASIGDSAFFGCSGISSIAIPDSVSSVGVSAFGGCSFTTVTVGSVLSDLSCFSLDERLQSITLGNGITTIRNDDFSGCSSLQSILIPKGVTSIGTDAFKKCTSLAAITVDEMNPNYSSEDGVLFNKDKSILIHYPAKKESESYVVPDSVVSMDFEGFMDGSMSEVTIGKNVKNGYTLNLTNGSIGITESDAVLMSGTSHRIAIEKNLNVPDKVLNISGVYDVYHIVIDDSPVLKDGAKITLTVDSKSKARSVYEIDENGNYHKLASEMNFTEEGTVYSFSVSQSAYIAIMAEETSIPYDVEICIGLIVAGLVIGALYTVIRGNKPA